MMSFARSFLRFFIFILFLTYSVYSFHILPHNTITRYRNNASSSSLNAFKELKAGEFENAVILSKLPVVVDFSASWCGPCKLMYPIFKALAEEYSNDYVKLYKVDIDLHKGVVDKYNIQGVPLFGVFKNGKMIASQSGAMTKDKLKEFIDKNIKPSS